MRGAFRRWLVVAVALIALASILSGANPRLLRSYPYNRRVRLAVGADDEQPAAGEPGGSVQERAAAGLASRSETGARVNGRAALRYLRGVLYWLGVVAACVALMAILGCVGARLFGYSPYVMYGGSMGSAVPLGSIAFIEDVPAESLEVGDVIVFQPPSSGEAGEPLMHRIVSIEEVDGQRVVRTKGDANGSADPWDLRLSGEGGRLVFAVPYVGHLLWFLQTRIAWVALILPLAAYLGYVALRRIWAPSGRREVATTQAS